MLPLIGLLAATDSGGAYISLLKLAPVLLLLWVFLRLLTWMDKDAVRAHLPREVLNSMVFTVGLAGFILFFFLPSFAIAYSVLFGAVIVAIALYLILRSQKVGLGDLQGEFKQWIRNIGKGKDKVLVAEAGEVQFINRKNDRIVPPGAEDASRPGYDAAQSMLTDPLKKSAEQVEVRS